MVYTIIIIQYNCIFHQGVLGVWLGVMNVMIEMNINLESIGLNQVSEKLLKFYRFVLYVNDLFYLGAKWLVGILGHTCELRSCISDCPIDRLSCWPYEGHHYCIVARLIHCIHGPGYDVLGHHQTFIISYETSS